MAETVCSQMAHKTIYDHKNEVARLILAAGCHLRLNRGDAGSSKAALTWASDPETKDVAAFSLGLNMKPALKSGRAAPFWLSWQQLRGMKHACGRGLIK